MLNHLVDSDHNSNAMVSRYHLQPQQPQQHTTNPSQHSTNNNNTKLQTNNNDTNINNNNTTINITANSNNNNRNILGNNNNIIDQAENKPLVITAANIVKNKVVGGNNYLHSTITMQNNSSIQPQRRPRLPNPVTSSNRCCTFKIVPEERRYRGFELEQVKILKEIMQKTTTKIEVTTTKDGALNFCIIGKEANLPVAKNLVLADFQTPVTLTLSVPKSIYRRLLANKGSVICNIQDETRTKITIPRKDEDSEIIKIVGLKSNAELAMQAFQEYAREFAEKTVERVTVETMYLLFITGPFNENLKKWEGLGAKVSTSRGILPSNYDRHSANADEVTFTIQGESNAVDQVKEEIIHIYEDKKKKCNFVNIEVKKAQHKYILGPNGLNLREFFAKTGVSVELPHESESETITLRGERSKLGPALSELYNQAHSETDEFLEAESWLHKYLIGPRRTNNIDFKASGVEVKGLEDKIKLHGPPTEVENIMEILETDLINLRKTIISKDIRVESRIHGYIIGRSGVTVEQIREESGANVIVPKSQEFNEFITLEGTQEAIAKAEEKINAIAKKYEASRKLVIDQQLHGSFIGRGGEKIKSIREMFPNVILTFRNQGSRNNEIEILGPKDEVEKCCKYLDEFHKQLQESNHQAQVPITNDIVKYLPDAEAAINKIKIDHKVKVGMYLDAESQDGKSALAKQQQNKDNKSVEQATAEGDVVASNAETKKKSKNKNKAKKQESSDGRQDDSQDELRANGKSSKPAESVTPEELYAMVVGKKEDVDQAKVKIAKLFQEIATTTEVEISVPHKLRSYLNPRSKMLQQFLNEFQHKVVISFPKQSQQQSEKQPSVGDDAANSTPTSNGISGTKNNSNKSNPRMVTVIIRGPKSIAKKAEKRLGTLLSDVQDKLDRSHSNSVTFDTAIFEKFTYPDKVRLNKIRESLNVKITIPDNRETPQIQATIVGYEKMVQSATQQLQELIKEVKGRTEETIEVPSLVHPRLIGSQGKAVKKFMEDYKVTVKFARQGEENPNSVTLSGSVDCVTKAKSHMLKLADQYMASTARAQVSGGPAPANFTNNSQEIAPEPSKATVGTS